MTGRKIRLSKCSIGSKELTAAELALKSEYLGMGLEVNNFEREIKKYLKSDMEVICVNSGTSALVLSLSGLGIGRGDEVLVPSITYVGSFQAISNVGAIPVACDVNLSTGFIAVDDARGRITNQTRAIMPVHYASNSSEMRKVYELAQEFQLRVIEDAAQAFGCSRDGENVGCSGDVVCFSFDGIKNITCGEGGAILTSDHVLAEKVRDARLLGVQRDTQNRFSGRRSWDFDVTEIGFRAHMSNIYASIGRAQLLRVDEFIIKRRELALQYKNHLESFQYVRTFDHDYHEICPHIFPVKIDEAKRSSLITAFEKEEVEYGFHYKPNHLLSYFKQAESELHNSETLWRQQLTLPLHVDLTTDDVDFVCRIINRAIENA
jgi:dTDP-4-amino-4,6-dideoxygalactose transaminase